MYILFIIYNSFSFNYITYFYFFVDQPIWVDHLPTSSYLIYSITESSNTQFLTTFLILQMHVGVRSYRNGGGRCRKYVY